MQGKKVPCSGDGVAAANLLSSQLSSLSTPGHFLSGPAPADAMGVASHALEVLMLLVCQASQVFDLWLPRCSRDQMQTNNLATSVGDVACLGILSSS